MKFSSASPKRPILHASAESRLALHTVVPARQVACVKFVIETCKRYAMNTSLPISDPAASDPGTAEVTGKEVLDMSISRRGKDQRVDKQHFDAIGKTIVRSNPVNVWTLV
jgi:hypothetical protein